jgi:energy-converting hydrogenase Eha subunit A
VAAIWAVAALLLFMYLVFSFITAANPEDPNAFPLNVLIASDHAVYIGVITNLVLGLLSVLVLDRAARASWISHVIFWGVNLGLLVFVVGLIVDTAELKRIGAPVMGVTLLIALAILAWRAVLVSTASLEAAEAELGGAATT